jgi:threonine dehydrogenase-like Zn-dependent dehydrogenase
MKAVVYRTAGNIALEAVPDPRIQQPTDAIIRIGTPVKTPLQAQG